MDSQGQVLLGAIVIVGLNAITVLLVLLATVPFGTLRFRLYWTWRPWVLRAAWWAGRRWRRWRPTTRVKRL